MEVHLILGKPGLNEVSTRKVFCFGVVNIAAPKAGTKKTF